MQFAVLSSEKLFFSIKKKQGNNLDPGWSNSEIAQELKGFLLGMDSCIQKIFIIVHHPTYFIKAWYSLSQDNVDNQQNPLIMLR